MNTKKKFLHFGLIAAIVPHLFCCVMPVVLGVMGLVMPEFAHGEILPEWLEPYLFVFSGGMLVLSWAIVLHDCHCSDCGHCHGAHHLRPQKIILTLVSLLFVASVILHLYV